MDLGGDTLKPINVTLNVPRKPKMKESKLETLKWEPVIEVNPYSKIIEAKRAAMNSLMEGDPNYSEVVSAIQTSQDDNVLLASVAMDKDVVIG